jgi:hypothetical protein
MVGIAANPSIELAFLKPDCTCAKLDDFSPGNGIFLQSIVLRRFSIVWKSEAPEGQFETKLALGSNPCW